MLIDLGLDISSILRPGVELCLVLLDQKRVEVDPPTKTGPLTQEQRVIAEEAGHV